MLYPIKRNNKYGFIDDNGNIIVEPIYKYIGQFSNQVCSITNEINEFHFNYNGKDYSHNESSIIDTNGNILFPFKKYIQFEEYFDDVTFCYHQKHKKFGVIDKFGKERIPFIFEKSEIEYSKFSNGLAKIKKEEKYGFINKNNEIVIPCIYDKVSHYNDGFALAKIKTKEFLINKKGEIFKSKFKIVSTFNENLAIVKQNKKFGFINENNELLIDFLFDEVWGCFVLGHCLVKLNNKYGLIDKSGKLIIDYQYQVVRSIGNDVFPAKVKKKWTLVNLSGNLQFEPKFDYIDDFDNRPHEVDYKNAKITRAVYNNKDYYIDVLGNIVIEITKLDKNIIEDELHNLLSQKPEKKVVWDKAKWSYDGFTITKKGAIKPFYFLLNWFKKMDLLTEEGIEVFKDKNNLEIGLYRTMFKDESGIFLDFFYDYWYEKQHIANYQIDSELKFENDENLDRYWEFYKKNYG